MTASLLPNMAISSFTLALYEDSNWYGVDYTLAEPMFWGKNGGCDFIDKGCKATS